MSKTIVWTNGVFDIIHPGHVELLRIAKSLGDFLVVGIDYDERVSALKGPTRPINNFAARRAVVDAIKYVDLTVGFGSEEEIARHLRLFQPSVVVESSEWEGKKIDYLENLEVRTFGRIQEHATTYIVDRIRTSQ
jgi:D-beta-D-heptose 7-phosphate kinase/D-beta-D-heptose 1-phosphate adenosyltransferase